MSAALLPPALLWDHRVDNSIHVLASGPREGCGQRSALDTLLGSKWLGTDCLSSLQCY